MSNLQQDIYALLAPIAPAGGVWQLSNTREPPVYPYVVFSRVSSTDNVSLGGPSAMQSTRVQVDMYALKLSEINALETAVETAFKAWAVQNVPLSSQDFYDDQVKAFRTSRDFSVWATN